MHVWQIWADMSWIKNEPDEQLLTKKLMILWIENKLSNELHNSGGAALINIRIQDSLNGFATLEVNQSNFYMH